MKWIHTIDKYGNMQMVNTNLIARIEYPVNLDILTIVFANGDTIEEVYEQEESRRQRYEEIQTLLT